MPAGSHRQGDAVQRVGCHTERLRRQTNASMCRSIAAPPKKVQPSIFLRKSGWAPGTPMLIVWCRTGITLGLIALHQLRSLQQWFGIRRGGRRWHVAFWLLVAGLTALGP